MPRVAVLDDYQKVALNLADWSVLPDGTKVEVFHDNLAGPDSVVERLLDFDIVVAMRERTPFPRTLLERLPKLRLLVSTGRRNHAIDVRAATELGILVCNTRSHGYSTVELTWGLILALVRSIPAEDAATRGGSWQTGIGIDLRGKVLGVMGLGNLGSQVATIGAAFGMSVIAWSQNLTEERASEVGVELVTKEDLLSHSDVLTVHLVLSDRTRGLIGAKELALMKPTSYLVNTSRGPIVDEKALVDALQDGVIAGAALDVFDQEPLPPCHPLLGLKNTVITPHVGYVTREVYELFFADAVEDIQAFLEGHPVRIAES